MDAGGPPHVQHLGAVPDLPSLIDLRKRLQAMLPRVDLSEVSFAPAPGQQEPLDDFGAGRTAGFRYNRRTVASAFHIVETSGHYSPERGWAPLPVVLLSVTG